MENIRNGNMPNINDMLGKVFFILWDGGKIKDLYRQGTNGLQGRAIFTISFFNSRNDETPFCKYCSFTVTTDQYCSKHGWAKSGSITDSKRRRIYNQNSNEYSNGCN